MSHKEIWTWQTYKNGETESGGETVDEAVETLLLRQLAEAAALLGREGRLGGRRGLVAMRSREIREM